MPIMTFEEILAAWLPGQRWFAGKGTPITGLAVAEQTTLISGDPGLRHLIVAVTQASGTHSYQLFLGLRADLPDRLEHVRIGPVDAGMVGYDGLHDPGLTAVLLEAMAGGESVGPLRFARRPGAQIDKGLESLVLTAEQSNTSLLFGEEAILKVFRRLSPGPNPDLEVPDALARLGSPHVPARRSGSARPPPRCTATWRRPSASRNCPPAPTPRCRRGCWTGWTGRLPRCPGWPVANARCWPRSRRWARSPTRWRCSGSTATTTWAR